MIIRKRFRFLLYSLKRFDDIRNIISRFCLICAFLASAGVSQNDFDIFSIAVLDFNGHNLPKEEVLALTDRFALELVNTNRFKVMEREQMNLILQEQEFQKSDCIDQGCAVQAGQLIAVKKIVIGTVAKVGSIYTVNVKMLDVATGSIDMILNEDCDCPIEKVLTEILKGVAQKLASMEVEEVVLPCGGNASLYVKTDPEDASIYLDGWLVDGRTPLMLENLIAGRHTVMVEKSDMQVEKDVDLISNQVVRIALHLEKQKTILKIITTPTEAEIYLDAFPCQYSDADYITPAYIRDIPSGLVHIFIFRIGYIDTLFIFDVKPNTVNSLYVTLEEAPKEIVKMQAQMLNDRKKWRFSGIFPWPPPRASASIDIPISSLFSNNTKRVSLGDVNNMLNNALDSCGYSDRSYYKIPGGFALVTRLEQINEDGSPKGPPHRWMLKYQSIRRFSLKGYLKALLTADPGFFRVIALVVNNQRFFQTDKIVDADETISWLSKGLNRLPESVEKTTFTPKYSCTALIYEFQRNISENKPFLAIPGRLSGKQHIQMSNLILFFKE